MKKEAIKEAITEALKRLDVLVLDPELEIDIYPESAQAAITVDILEKRYVTDYHSGNRYGLNKAKMTFGVYLCTPFARRDQSIPEYVTSVVEDIRDGHPGTVHSMAGFAFEHGFCLGVLLR